jgi:hypothetical protein
MRTTEEKRMYHHRIVAIYCNHYMKGTKPKGVNWFNSELITYELVYWALRNVCALTSYKMSDFKINRTSINVL